MAWRKDLLLQIDAAVLPNKAQAGRLRDGALDDFGNLSLKKLEHCPLAQREHWSRRIFSFSQLLSFR